MITGHLFPAKNQTLLEPSAEPVGERSALVAPLIQKVEQLPLAIQIRERLAAQDRHELVAVQRAVHPILEVLLTRGEIVGVLWGDALQSGQNIARDLYAVERLSPDVRIAEDVNVPRRARIGRGNVQQLNPLIRGDIPRAAFCDFGISCLVEQCRDPQLEIESRGHEDIGTRKERHEARLGLHVVWILIPLRDCADFTPIADDFSRDRGVGRERGDDLDRSRRRRYATAHA